MKFFLCILLATLTVSAKDVLIHRMHIAVSNGAVGSDTIEFMVDEASLKAFGEWAPGTGKAPAVTRNQAVKLALDSAGLRPAEGRVLVSLQQINKWEINTKNLPAGISPWFYEIKFQNAQPTSKHRYFIVTVGGVLARAVEVN
jgi:hypothetical protein